jgi:YbgC/YbaW family acyl-CoA thioester hydrolase
MNEVSPTAQTALVVEKFLAHQREFYDGGDLGAAEQLLAEDVVWHVPGTSPIAGDYRGRQAVLDYFQHRRALAGGALRMTSEGQAHHDEAVARLADGRACLAGQDVSWRTVGVYRLAEGRIAEAWLVPLDLRHFDKIWSATRAEPFVYIQRVRPRECAASTMLGHPRFLEFFEAAFIECWRHRFGSMDATLGRARSLTVAAVNVNYRACVRWDDELRIEVTLDRITKRSIRVHYDAFVEATLVAEATSRYVCLDTQSGRSVSLPDGIADAQHPPVRPGLRRGSRTASDG